MYSTLETGRVLRSKSRSARNLSALFGAREEAEEETHIPDNGIKSISPLRSRPKPSYLGEQARDVLTRMRDEILVGVRCARKLDVRSP